MKKIIIVLLCICCLCGCSRKNMSLGNNDFVLSDTNTTTKDATLTASKTTAKKAALNKTSLKLKKGKTYQLKTKNVKGTVTVVEGNYNSSIHCFRTITKSSLQQTGFSVDTRY